MAAICCPKCQALVSANAESCYRCGARLGRAYAVERGSRSLFSDMDVTRGLTTFMIVMYVFLCIVLGPQSGDDVRSGGLLGALTPSSRVLFACGILNVDMVRIGHEWWRLVTSIFVHLNVMHLVFNTLALWTLGPRVVEVFGTPKAIILFVACGLIASFVSFIFDQNGGGASGALCGYIGVLLFYGYRSGDPAGRALIRTLWMWISMIALFGIVLNETINNHAHVGGFLGGLALASVVGWDARDLARSQNLLAVACGVLVGLSWGLTMWYFEPNLAVYHVVTNR